MNKFLLLVLLFSTGLPEPVGGQDIPPSTQQKLENLAGATESEPEDDHLLQALEHFRKHPLDINTAGVDALQELFFLTDLQITNLVAYRQLLGKFISVHELQAVPAWTAEVIEKITPYIIVSPEEPPTTRLLSRLKGGDHRLLSRVSRVLEDSKGYDTALANHYLGDPDRLLVRYTYQFRNQLYYGLTGDKDAGEPFFKGAQRAGFDFYSAHFFARNLGKIKALALGDYTLNMGQGLIQWHGQAFGKSGEVISVKRQAPVLMPYRSAGEYSFNRGSGITLQEGRFELTGFVSSKKSNTNLIDSGVAFSSMLTSGYNRTHSEVADRHTTGDLSYGGVIAYKTTTFKMAVNAVEHRFSVPFRKSDEPYNLFSFSGTHLFNSSIDYAYTFHNIHFFGEGALDGSYHKAFIQGLLASVDPKADVAVVYRNSSPGFQSLFGNAFTENTLPVNERGIYTGLVLRPISHWQVSAYADLYRFPWLRYRADGPTSGSDYLLQVVYQPSRQSDLYLRYRDETKPLNEAAGFYTRYPENKNRRSLRLNYTLEPHRMFSVKTRVEAVWYNTGHPDAEEGFLVYTEGSFKTQQFKTNLRLQYFETGGYNSRIYAYESDVLYSYSIPPVFDKGLRYYINLNAAIGKHLSLWARWAQTVYRDKKVIGSGLDEITGNRKTTVTVQGIFSF